MLSVANDWAYCKYLSVDAEEYKLFKEDFILQSFLCSLVHGSRLVEKLMLKKYITI